MRFSILAPALILGALASSAWAMPAPEIPAPNDIHRVQLQCTPQSCVDPRTGVYTQSTCDRYGCRPISGPVGRVRGGAPGFGGYDDDYERPRRRQWDRGGYGDGVDCNPSRCIVDGRVWESTCDRRGCRPLRPARGSRW